MFARFNPCSPCCASPSDNLCPSSGIDISLCQIGADRWVVTATRPSGNPASTCGLVLRFSDENNASLLISLPSSVYSASGEVILVNNSNLPPFDPFFGFSGFPLTNGTNQIVASVTGWYACCSDLGACCGITEGVFTNIVYSGEAINLPPRFSSFVVETGTVSFFLGDWIRFSGIIEDDYCAGYGPGGLNVMAYIPSINGPSVVANVNNLGFYDSGMIPVPYHSITPGSVVTGVIIDWYSLIGVATRTL